jgi:hypothetical protein
MPTGCVAGVSQAIDRFETRAADPFVKVVGTASVCGSWPTRNNMLTVA